MVSISSIYSTLGNSSSLVPLAIKDIANSCGLTAASYMAGDKNEGKDRFIDEFGTQAIWLWGIPAYKKLLDFLIKHVAKFDPDIDVRILSNNKIAKIAEEFAPNSKIKSGIENAIKKSKTIKGLTIGKFIISTALTSLTYFGLTKFRHKYTEEQIKKDYYNRNSQSKDLSFGGGFKEFMFDPVKNLMIVDASITTERLTEARNLQEFLGYLIKEGSFWLFMYFAGDKIKNIIEKNATKKGKSIDLDIRVLENEEFKNAFATGDIVNHIKAFKVADNGSDDANLYKFIVDKNNENLVVKAAKTSDQIKIYEDSKPFIERISNFFKLDDNNKALKTGVVDTRSFIDLSENSGIRKTREQIERLYNEFKNSNESVDAFFKSVRKNKRLSVLTNMGACIGALGIISPAIMLLVRKLSPNSGYQVKADIEKNLKQSEYVA